MPRILIIEDDRDVAGLVLDWLKTENYSVEIAYDGEEGTEYLKQKDYDLLILDWSLPGKTGMEICQEYRARQGKAPVLMLTGRGSVADKEAGLDSGADDYLTKPFSMRELSARVRALLRRPPVPVSHLLEVGSLAMDPIKHTVTRNGKPITLLKRDFELLEFLMRHPGEIFSTDALLSRVWEYDQEASADAVRTAVKRLRKKLDESEDETSSVIENVRRVGYRLKPE
ncbi:MAG TPA: response regulator transcription factor [Planktothrix sp.]|jgi:DNA-binding response OmpR family regulator